MDKTLDSQIRIVLFQWLSERFAKNAGVFTRTELEKEFLFQGKVITLIGASGIWFPKGFEIPISITTSPKSPYPDRFKNGTLKYSYRGKDVNHRDNVGLRKAFTTKTPLVYFRGIAPGKYEALWPVSITGDNPSALSISASVTQVYAMPGFEEMTATDVLDKEYGDALVKTRLHQPAFRFQVLKAYNQTCTFCGLKHPELLDAAHIIADNEPDGNPEVPNGLSLCKIHHVSYDQKIIGITSDYEIKVREDVLEEVDGPMLKYGIQSLEGKFLLLPKRKEDYPDKNKLDRRFEEFKKKAV